ncbi:FecR family protein [Mucilaginibacter sp.]
MKKFFKKPKPYHNSASDRKAERDLVRQYFDNTNLNTPADTGTDAFDEQGIYNRITEQIEHAGLRKVVRRKRWLTAAAVTGFLITAGGIAMYSSRVAVTVVNSKETMAANGQVTQVTLADGTQVWLNSGSKLKYPETFTGAKREVNLVGEAFFEVKHDNAHPFIVHSGKLTTQVLGTSFNVKAYSADPVMKVEVVTGKVGVMRYPAVKGAQALLLTPNQEAVYNTAKGTFYKDGFADAALLSSWKDGKLVFKNQLLPEVTNALQRRFNISLAADANLQHCTISADFTGVALPDILTVLARLVKGKVTKTPTAYQLHGKGC